MKEWDKKIQGYNMAVIAQQLHRIADALEAIENKMKEPEESKVQALNETSRALENSRGGTQL